MTHSKNNAAFESAREGLLLIDKPAAWTSHDIVKIARPIMKTKTIGHSGTLDPAATGLLLLLVGRSATSKQSAFLKLPKSYSGIISLGSATDTWDASGQVTKHSAVPALYLADVKAATAKLTGVFEHVIPPYSAKRINGTKMYKLAREGAEMETQKSATTVTSWENLTLNEAEITFKVNCASGTYVRSLAVMLGEILGVPAHLKELRRESVGEFNVTSALPLADFRAWPYEKTAGRLISI